MASVLKLLRRKELLVVGGFLVLANFMVYQFGVHPLPQFFLFSDVHHQEDVKKLGRILREAATEDNTVIITTLNRAWSEPNSTFDLFLESFHVGKGTKPLLRHVVVACLDPEAYSRCLEVHPRRCYFIETAEIDFSNEKSFMTPEFLKMMWRRIEFLDVMWFRDPFPRLSKDVDFQISCDRFNGNDSDIKNEVNTGFIFVQANNRTIGLYDYWYASRFRFPNKNDQEVFNDIKEDWDIAEIGLRMRFLDTKYFGGFCEPSRDLDKACTMHANCCVGLDNKINDLREVLVDWRNYLYSAETYNGEDMTWRKPKNCMKQWWWKKRKTSIRVKT
ncbi:unnamed protein product [Thlaspi arvense]|uniref:Nucleotide-diphospho-sugar transferase domain-containing protein n=1 Tax=Thlaspi arvense TaxID=13288 RepID=A0AAU9TA92_THLAR|nr:unnamed protein product [Thlaspi arvense]